VVGPGHVADQCGHGAGDRSLGLIFFCFLNGAGPNQSDPTESVFRKRKRIDCPF
jgi:hypothetical protein